MRVWVKGSKKMEILGKGEKEGREAAEEKYENSSFQQF
jgi:hypothetical protein